MIRVQRILQHPLFCQSLEKIRRAEADRPFCGHDLEHLLSVARIMTLLGGEGAPDRPLLYGAALVHDLGRGQEYLDGTPHEQAVLPLAGTILADCGFTGEEVRGILEAVVQHRSAWQGQRSALGRLLYLADKKSRTCYACPAAAECNWPMEKRNLTIEY